ARALVAARIEPGMRAAVADPRHETAVQVHGGAVVAQVGTFDGAVDRDDVTRRQVVVEGELDRRPLVPDDDAAEVLLRLDAAPQRSDRVIAPERRWPKARVHLVAELADIERVVRGAVGAHA